MQLMELSSGMGTPPATTAKPQTQKRAQKISGIYFKNKRNTWGHCPLNKNKIQNNDKQGTLTLAQNTTKSKTQNTGTKKEQNTRIKVKEKIPVNPGEEKELKKVSKGKKRC